MVAITPVHGDEITTPRTIRDGAFCVGIVD